MRYAAGIDLGGTFVKYALVAENGDIVFESKLAVGGKLTREDIIDTIRKSIRQILDLARENAQILSGIGIGSPGLIYEGVVLGGAENLDRWENIPLGPLFSKEFELPVFVDNDANVMGLGEVSYGAAKNCTDVIFITVGTGIGGAIVMNGQLYGGYKNRGTELGHIVMVHNGIECNCGGRGCLEAYASTSALIRQYASITKQDPEVIDGKYIVEKYLAGETVAVSCMNEHTDMLGHGIAGFVNTFAPQKVVIGGGISEAGQFYIDLIKKYTFRYAMRDCAANTEVVGAILGNKAGYLGAATMVFRNVNN